MVTAGQHAAAKWTGDDMPGLSRSVRGRVKRWEPSVSTTSQSSGTKGAERAAIRYAQPRGSALDRWVDPVGAESNWWCGIISASSSRGNKSVVEYRVFARAFDWNSRAGGSIATRLKGL